MSEIRKQKINKRRSLPGLLPMQPSQLAGPASRRPSPPPSSVGFVLNKGRGVWPARARATAPRHLLACLPALPSSSRCPGRCHAPSPALSHGRTPPSPPLAITTATGPPSLPRLAQRLRLDPLFLSTEPRGPGRAATPPRSSFPSPATEAHRRRFATSGASPSPLSHPAASL